MNGMYAETVVDYTHGLMQVFRASYPHFVNWIDIRLMFMVINYPGRTDLSLLQSCLMMLFDEGTIDAIYEDAGGYTLYRLITPPENRGG
jgi:hypothetical protein